MLFHRLSILCPGYTNQRSMGCGGGGGGEGGGGGVVRGGGMGTSINQSINQLLFIHDNS